MIGSEDWLTDSRVQQRKNGPRHLLDLHPAGAAPYPATTLQTCIVHLIRNSLDYATPYLLPPSVEDWLPKDHLARFVVDIVDQLDLSALTRQYRGTGSAAYHPTLMLGLSNGISFMTAALNFRRSFGISLPFR